MTSSCAIRGWDPRSGSVARFLGLGKASWAWEWHILGWLGWVAGHLLEIVHKIPDGPIYVGKTTFLESKPQLSPVFCTFLGSPWICLGISKMDPPKKGCEVNFGRRGKLTCHRIDELFKPNWVPRPTQTPRRPPRSLPRSFGKW